MKGRFLSWAKERLFLIVVVFLYSILAFINLGDFSAPQTFQNFQPGEKFLIVLPEAQKVSNVIFYTGTTKNDFKIHYQVKKPNDCACENNLDFLNFEDFTKPQEVNIDGPFIWSKVEIKQAVSMILIQPNRSREIAIGEVGVLNENSEKIDGIKVFKVKAGEMAEKQEIVELTDETTLIPKERTAMNSMIFDELYFGQTAYQYANGLEGYETVHPPLGKILQSIPIFITGKMTPFTWRFMGTVAGILILVVVYYLALEIFKKKYFANIAILLTSLSCLHFIQTRVGTVDSHLCLFTALSYLFMFKFINSKEDKKYFALSGFFFGCAVSVKWSGLFGGIGLAILFFYHLFKKYKKKFKKIFPWLLRGGLWFILIPLVIYCSSYLAFSKTTGANSLADVYEQGANLFNYHANEATPHEASSPWFTWPISLVGFPFYASEDNTKTIGLFGNYVLCYISVIALVITIYYAVSKRDKASVWILVAYLSLLLPYAFIQRPMFLYHYLPASIFAILATVNMLQKFSESKFLVRLVIISTLVSFILLYPKMTGI